MRNGCLRNKRVKSASLAALLGMLACCAVAAQGVDFVLDDLDGNQRRLSEFRGKWVLVNYWATWCPPCLEEMPELEMFHNRHKARDAVVLGVKMEPIEIGRLKAFVEEPGLPTSYLVSPQGEVVARQVGAVTAEMLEAFLEQRSGGQK